MVDVCIDVVTDGLGRARREPGVGDGVRVGVEALRSDERGRVDALGTLTRDAGGVRGEVGERAVEGPVITIGVGGHAVLEGLVRAEVVAPKHASVVGGDDVLVDLERTAGGRDLQLDDVRGATGESGRRPRPTRRMRGTFTVIFAW